MKHVSRSVSEYNEHTITTTYTCNIFHNHDEQNNDDDNNDDVGDVPT